MKVLGIESASLVASVAMVCDGQMTAEYTLNLKKTHSQTLLPMIDQMMDLLGEDSPDSVSARRRRRGSDLLRENRWSMFLPWMPWPTAFT